MISLALVALGLSPAWAAIELITVTKATQKDCKLSFVVADRPHPNGSGARLVTLTIPAKQVAAFPIIHNHRYTFQIRDGNNVPLNVPLAFELLRDGTLQTEITIAESFTSKAWAVLHVWLAPEGSGTAYSIDLGSYLK